MFDCDGVDRRGFLRCMAWAGTGLLCSLGASGQVTSQVLPQVAQAGASGLHFVQISDSHIGFSKEANPDVVGTLKLAVERINALPERPAFVLHTGDLSHLGKASEFDTVRELLKEVRADRVFYVPGEHDVATDNGKGYLAHFGQGSKGGGWYSFDHSGVHFIGLVNVLELQAGGLGQLGEDQLSWLQADVEALSASTPIVVFAHIPLWQVYPEWGWGTQDGARALGLLRRFGSLTVLNGHIHQVLRKVEGQVTFHTAMSTAFPQPAPGKAPSPGPMQVPAGELRAHLGITDVTFAPGSGNLAVVDRDLLGAVTRSEVKIDNFKFQPEVLSVPIGSEVRWTNQDDMIHSVVGPGERFRSPLLDTGEVYSYRFDSPGTYDYFCGLHPKMTGKIVVINR